MATRVELAAKAWPVLVDVAQRRQVITYEELAHRLGYAKAATTMKNALGPIQNFCIWKGHPPLTSLIVNKGSGMPGDGFIERDGSVAESQHRVWDYEWASVSAPSVHQLQLASAGVPRTRA